MKYYFELGIFKIKNWFYVRREKRHGTKLNKFGREYLNAFISHLSIDDEFTIRQHLGKCNNVTNKKINGYNNALVNLPIIFITEGYAIESKKTWNVLLQENEQYFKLTERGKKLLIYRSIDKFLKAEQRDIDANLKKNWREIYWWQLALGSYVFGIISGEQVRHGLHAIITLLTHLK